MDGLDTAIDKRALSIKYRYELTRCKALSGRELTFLNRTGTRVRSAVIQRTIINLRSSYWRRRGERSRRAALALRLARVAGKITSIIQNMCILKDIIYVQVVKVFSTLTITSSTFALFATRPLLCLKGNNVLSGHDGGRMPTPPRANHRSIRKTSQSSKMGMR